MLKLIALLFIVSCASNPRPSGQADQVAPQVTNKDLWMGREWKELALHPIYATLTLRERDAGDGLEVKSFENYGGRTAKFNHMSYSATGKDIICNHVFTLQNKKIIDFYRVGDCGPEMIQFRPLDKNGNPVLVQGERALASEVITSCKTSADCNNGRSCKDNQCLDLGLWGRLFN